MCWVKISSCKCARAEKVEGKGGEGQMERGGRGEEGGKRRDSSFKGSLETL